MLEMSPRQYKVLGKGSVFQRGRGSISVEIGKDFTHKGSGIRTWKDVKYLKNCFLITILIYFEKYRKIQRKNENHKLFYNSDKMTINIWGVYLSSFIYIYISTYICIYISINIYIYLYRHVDIKTCLCTYVCVYTQMHTLYVKKHLQSIRILTRKQKMKQNKHRQGKRALESNATFQKEQEINKTGFKSCLCFCGNSSKLFNYVDPQVPHV